MKLKVIDTGENSAVDNMNFDQDCLLALDPDQDPILHLYDFSSPSATYGYFIDPKTFFNMQYIQESNFQIAKRVTGGGIIFHLTDLAFTFFLPKNSKFLTQNTLKNYQFVNEIVLKAIDFYLSRASKGSLLNETPSTKGDQSCHFCMEKPTIYDVIIDGKKVGGAAQRRKENGLLHHGSISLLLPPWDEISKLLSVNSEVIEKMKKNTFPLGESKDLLDVRLHLKKALIDAFKER